MAELVHLVRHGEVHNPRHLAYASLPGFGLSTRGNLQARAAGNRLAGRPVRAVWSSPLQRATETAAHLAAPHGLEVQVRPQLVEWKLLDRWAGHPWDRLPELFPGEVEAYLEHPTDLDFGSESLAQLGTRIAEVIQEASDAVATGEVVVVGHQDPLQAGRLVSTGQALDQLFMDRPEHGSVITLQPGRPWIETGRWDPA